MTKADWEAMVEADRPVYDELIRDLAGTAHISEEAAKEFATRFFDIGFKEGQSFVWYGRSGYGMNDGEVPNGNVTITSTDGVTCEYRGGKLIPIDEDPDHRLH
jgi:hypothetical protein